MTRKISKIKQLQEENERLRAEVDARSDLEHHITYLMTAHPRMSSDTARELAQLRSQDPEAYRREMYFGYS